MNGNEWTNYIYDLHQHITEQEKKMEALEKRLLKLENDFQERNTNTIEKIEYNFDQLKIEHLDGTLHIGISPNDLANIEDFNVHQNPLQKKEPPLKQKLISELSGYIHENGPSLIQDFSAKYNHPIDDDFQLMMIQDIEKQLPGRISLYEQEALKDSTITNDQQSKQYISDQIKHEIHQSLLNYIQTNRRKGEDQ
ncbi:spore germination protein GerPC [Virgibacillus indicus]|uniref:spore germination protein GerPC n=1 Tax=Virgibacillus indicus TaxID=2024554 RepID=UPI0013FDF970|nr:spore germination protein GerPC [Virgibacillus indicus]